MRRVTTAIDIDAPARDVWDLYADVPHSPDWVPFSEEILYVSGPPGVGQVYRERTRLLGISDVAEWRIIEWEPPRRQVQLSTDKGMDARLVIEVEPLEPFDAGRSRVRQDAIFESRLPGPVGWAQSAPWTCRHQGACATLRVGGNSRGRSPAKTNAQPNRSASVT